MIAAAALWSATAAIVLGWMVAVPADATLLGYAAAGSGWLWAAAALIIHDRDWISSDCSGIDEIDVDSG